jgi:hypothetical protein
MVHSYVYSNEGLCGDLVSVGTVGTNYVNGINGTNLGNCCPDDCPSPPPPSPPPSPPSPFPQWSATSLTVTPDDPRATTVEFSFQSSDVSAHSCRLDGGDEEPCVSPFALEWLQPGEHTFTVTPTGVDAASYRPKTLPWTVSPAFTLEPIDDATAPFNLSQPQSANKVVRVLSSLTAPFTFTARVVDESSTFTPVVTTPLRTGAVAAAQEAQALLEMTVNSMAMAADDTYTAVMAVRDGTAAAEGVVSELRVQLTVTVQPRTNLLTFPPNSAAIRATSPGRSDSKAVAGTEAENLTMWFINVAEGGAELTFEVEVKDDTWSAGAAFTVTSGLCTLASDGSCFRSPNYPSNYNNNQQCSITVAAPVTLSVTTFSTEGGNDLLTVNGQEYSGTSGPDGVEVTTGTTITFTSDRSGRRAGFEICGALPSLSPRHTRALRACPGSLWS